MESENSTIKVEEPVQTITVSSRIPEFWQDVPRLCFIQAEAVLHPQRLTDEAKCHLIITKLGKDAITQVTDILESPPKTGKYEVLKNSACQVVVRNFIQGFGISVMQRPTRSPDLNMIERLLDHLKRNVQSHDSAPTTLQELKDAVIQEWDTISLKRKF
ncbi:unnamed protein product [Euphydryas editha]|uniref:DUF7041 domain-containing protein n=1 Tax=Euphydryas editha TaxID=104508 RepID=A0AAU9TXT1_EUPED|nr:unnamed protein product [Euphydryas editha]